MHLAALDCLTWHLTTSCARTSHARLGLRFRPDHATDLYRSSSCAWEVVGGSVPQARSSPASHLRRSQAPPRLS